MRGCSVSLEDLLEKIYEAVERDGYVRAVDLASRLRLKPSTVTRMVQRLGDQGLIRYEKYRGLALTPEGRAVGHYLLERHAILEEFLRLLGCQDPIAIYQDVEGMEHYVSRETLERIRDFVRFARHNPAWVQAYRSFRSDGRPAERSDGEG